MEKCLENFWKKDADEKMKNNIFCLSCVCLPQLNSSKKALQILVNLHKLQSRSIMVNFDQPRSILVSFGQFQCSRKLQETTEDFIMFVYLLFIGNFV